MPRIIDLMCFTPRPCYRGKREDAENAESTAAHSRKEEFYGGCRLADE